MAPLVLPVIVSPEVKVPEGTVSVTVVELGLVIIEAVTPLEDPVMVSAMLKLPDAPTVAVIVPTGYSEIPVAKVCVTCCIIARPIL